MNSINGKLFFSFLFFLVLFLFSWRVFGKVYEGNINTMGFLRKSTNHK